MKKFIKEAMSNIAEERELDREIAFEDGKIAYAFCIFRQYIIPSIVGAEIFMLVFFLLLTPLNTARLAIVNTYHNVVRQYEDKKNDRITYGQGNLHTELSNGETVNISLEDGSLNVDVGEKQLIKNTPKIYYSAQIKDDLLYLTSFNGQVHVQDLIAE